MAKYKVKNTTILHDGKVFASGDEVELTEQEAKRLGEWVSIIKDKTPKQPENKTTAKPANKANTKPENTEEKEGENDGK